MWVALAVHDHCWEASWKSPARLTTQLVPYTGSGVGVGAGVGIGVAAVAASAALGNPVDPGKNEGTGAPGGTPSASTTAANRGIAKLSRA